MDDTTENSSTGAPDRTGRAAPLSPEDASELVLDWAREQDLEADRLGDAHVAVTLPGDRKLKTTVSVRCSRRSIDLQAFVIRHPDENRERFQAWLLHKNSKFRGLAFSTDHLGDVYLDASLPVEAWSAEVLDSLLGRFLSAADESFNDLLVLGFLTSMKKEWAWRISRGESTRNLAAFESLLSGPDNEFLDAGGSAD